MSTTVQFTATVKGTTNTGVTWSVDGVTGGNSTVGTISGTGLYTAPSQAGSYTVVATSVADSSKTANAAVTVLGAVTVTPATALVAPEATQQFTATVQGSSTEEFTWSVDGVTGGNSTVGTISTTGLYTTPSQPGSHTVVATCVADTSKTASAAVTVLGAVAVTPATALVAPEATQQFTATVQGSSDAEFTWSVDGVAGGNSTTGTISSSGLYTAPNATAAHTVTAAVTGDTSLAASSTLTVINSSAGSVLTYHNDDARDGAFTQETTLTPSNVNSSQFGKLVVYPVDGQIYAQPLYLPQVTINGEAHNVVFAVTENDTVYAFDADGSQTTPLWNVSLGTAVPQNGPYGIYPELGITSTPVLDVTTGTLYVLAETTNGPYQLSALDITSGAEKFGGPVTVTGSVSGTGTDSVDGTITLETNCYQRMGLALDPVSNSIYLGFGHCNHGWELAYNKTTLQPTAIFNVTPDGQGGGLWASGGAPAINDITGDLFLISGVDLDDPPSGYNDSFLRLAANNLSELDFFEPDNEATLSANDADLGSGSNVIMPDNPSSTPHETIGGGKDGRIFVVNRDEMGSFNAQSNNVIQTVQTGTQQYDNIFSTPVYFNGLLYFHCNYDVLQAYSWSDGMLSTAPVASGNFELTTYGATASLSANGTSNAIIWEIDNSNFPSGGPAVLRAYDAANIANEIYDSTQNPTRDSAGVALKFTSPTVAGGKVFVPTSNELDIYGLLP